MVSEKKFPGVAVSSNARTVPFALWFVRGPNDLNDKPSAELA